MQETQAEAPAIGQPERAVVLLVDDQPMIGEAIRRMLLDQPDIDFQLLLEGPASRWRRPSASGRR